MTTNGTAIPGNDVNSETPSPPAQPNAQRKKVCGDCRNDIDLRADRCHHCGSYQDWRRHLNLGIAILSVIVAATAIISAIYTALSIAGPKYSDIQPVVENIDGDLYVTVANSGNARAVLLSTEFRITLPNQRVLTTYPIRARSTAAIEHSSVHLVRFGGVAFTGDEPSDPEGNVTDETVRLSEEERKALKSAKHELQFRVRHANGTVESKVLNAPPGGYDSYIDRLHKIKESKLVE
jgi:hypothetical protein